MLSENTCKVQISDQKAKLKKVRSRLTENLRHELLQSESATRRESSEIKQGVYTQEKHQE